MNDMYGSKHNSEELNHSSLLPQLSFWFFYFFLLIQLCTNTVLPPIQRGRCGSCTKSTVTSVRLHRQLPRSPSNGCLGAMGEEARSTLADAAARVRAGVRACDDRYFHRLRGDARRQQRGAEAHGGGRGQHAAAGKERMLAVAPRSQPLPTAEPAGCLHVLRMLQAHLRAPTRLAGTNRVILR
jgi:hypothetical protein